MSNKKKSSQNTGGSNTKGNVSAVACLCKICDDAIVEPGGKRKRDDSIFCNGICNGWIHRQCAGLSRTRFIAFVGSDDSVEFVCPTCRTSHLEAKVSDLQQEVSSCKSLLAVVQAEVNSLKASGVATCSPSANVPSAPSSYAHVVSHTDSPSQPNASGPQAKSHVSSTNQDRKFNLVLYGLPEHPKGTPRNERISEDHDSVLSSLQQLIPTFDEYHIRDCFRLGKFNDVSSRPCPVLVKFNCASDVVNILAKYRSLSSNARRFFIKPDLSPVERSIESLLHCKKWGVHSTPVCQHTKRQKCAMHTKTNVC